MCKKVVKSQNEKIYREIEMEVSAPGLVRRTDLVWTVRTRYTHSIDQRAKARAAMKALSLSLKVLSGVRTDLSAHLASDRTCEAEQTR